jgi:SWIM zinc finger
VAQPAVEYAYRYAVGSRLEGQGDRTLALATADGPAANPLLFRGQVRHPVAFADALLTVGAVARARFSVPPAMLAHALALADPVVTAADDRLRFEAFSACASVYARLDLLPGSVDGVSLGTGTTNVDLGAEVRAALAGVTATARLDLEVGQEELAVEVDGQRHDERRVALPDRWIRGFSESQAIMAGMTRRGAVDGAAFRRFLRALPKGAKRPIHVSARDGELTIGHRAASDAVSVVVAGRLRLLERPARWATGVELHADAVGASAWTLTLPDSRFTLAISSEAWRGFSGEGQLLDALAMPEDRAVQARVASAIAWRTSVRPESLASELRLDRDAVSAALARLAGGGQLGFDVADGAYFARRLPFAPGGTDRRQPRLRRAQALVDAGAVRLEPGSTDRRELIGWVTGRSSDYRVRLGPDGRACTCPWWGRHPGDRGPCAHMLALQLVATSGPERAVAAPGTMLP